MRWMYEVNLCSIRCCGHCADMKKLTLAPPQLVDHSYSFPFRQYDLQEIGSA